MGGGVFDLRSLVYGGLASVTAELGTFAIDTTKTRLQIQGQKIDSRHAEVKYRGMLHALLRISREEGIRALYSGIAPAVLRQATYGTIKMGVYESAKRHLMKNKGDESFLANMGCGMFAGVVSSSIANPTDVLKIRMQAQNEHFSRKNVIECFVDMYKQEGVRGLWRGVVPTAQRAAVIVGVELSVYDFSKRQFISSQVLPDNITNHISSSSVAALAGAIASNPIDVIRTRLMNQRNLKSAIISGVNVESVYTSSLDCLVQTVRSEGVSALYKGFIPTWLRLGPWNIIFFVTFEQLKKFY